MVMGTRAQQLALYVIFPNTVPDGLRQSAVLRGSASLSIHQGCAGRVGCDARADGSPGEFVTIARSHGDEWYWQHDELDAAHVECRSAFLVRARTLPRSTQTADAATQPKHVEIRRRR